MVEIQRPFTAPQEPEVPETKPRDYSRAVLNLDKRQAQDPNANLVQDIQDAAALGVQKFRYREQVLDLPAAQAALGVAAEAPQPQEPDAPPSPDITVSPGTEYDDQVATRARSGLRARVARSFVDEVGVADMPDDAAGAFADWFLGETGRAPRIDILEALNRLPEGESREAFKAKVKRWNEYSAERSPVKAPELGYAFGEWSADKRAEEFLRLSLDEDPAVKEAVNYFAPFMGEQAGALVAQTRTMARRIEASNLLASVSEGERNALESAYLALQDGDSAVGVLMEADAFKNPDALWVLRQEAEAAAKAIGLPFRALAGKPADWVLNTKEREKTPPIVRMFGGGDKPTAARPTLQYARESTRALLGRVLNARYGREAADLVLASESKKAHAFEALNEIFKDFDPNTLSSYKAAPPKGEQSAGDLLTVVGALTGGEVMNSEEARGRVRVADWFFKALMYGDKVAGSAMEEGGLFWGLGGDWGKPYTEAVVFPDGSVYTDPVQAMKYAAHLRKSDPEAAWKPEIISGNEFSIYPKYTQERVEDEAGNFVGMAVVESEDYARMKAESSAFNVVRDRLNAEFYGDDKLSPALVGTVALWTSMGVDPFSYAGTGLGVAARSIDGSVKYAQRLAKTVAIPEEAAARGIKSLEAIAKELKAGQKAGASRLGHGSKAQLSNGLVLNADANKKYRVLRKLVGDDMADSAMVALSKGQTSAQDALRAFTYNDRMMEDFAATLSKNGMGAVNAGEAAAIWESLIPAVDKVVHSATWNSSYLLGRASALASGDDSRQFARAKGLYMAGIPVTPLITETLGAAAKRLGQGGRALIGQRDVPLKLRQLARVPQQASAALRALFDVNVVRLRDPATGKHLGFRQLSFPEARIYNLYRQRLGAAETYVRGAQQSWLLREARDAMGRRLEAPEFVYKDVGHMIESGMYYAIGDFDDAVRYLAGVRKGRKNAHLFQGLDEAGYEAQKRKLFDSVTDEEVAFVRRQMEPYREIFDNLKALTEKTGEVYRTVGIADPHPFYVPHHLRPPKGWDGKSGLYRLSENGDVVAKAEDLEKSKGRFSGHTMERKGPPTLFDAEMAGLNPVLDMRAAMELRLQRFVQDMAEAEMIQALGKVAGNPSADGLRAFRALFDDQNALRTGSPAEMEKVMRDRVRESVGKAASFHKRLDELSDALREQRKAEQRLARLVEKAKDPLEIEVAEKALDKIREERLARVGEFAQDFDLNAAEAAAWSEHTQFGQNAVRNRRGQLKRLMSQAEEAGDANAFNAYQAEYNALDGYWGKYNEASRNLAAMGIPPDRQGALTWELYKKPTIFHLSVDELDNLVEKHAKAKASIDNLPESRAGMEWFGNPEDAYQSWLDAGRPEGTHYTLWLEEDFKPLVQSLENTYLPIETLLSLRSMGARLGKKEILKDAGMYAGITRVMDGIANFFLPMNRFFKGAVTVWNPSLHFGRRNQIDAYSKMTQYSGLYAVGGALRAEFRAWRNGTLDNFMDGLGNRVNAREAWEQGKTLFQTFERRLDVLPAAAPDAAQGSLATVRDKIAGFVHGGQETIDKRVARRAGRTTQRAEASTREGLLPRARASATQGSAPRAVEQAIPWGRGASEAFDNEVRAWVYFVNLKEGKPIADALDEAFRVGRDYTNLTYAERRFFGVLPITFYNFFKQNLRSIPSLLDRGGLRRVVTTEKFRSYMEANLPEDVRPQWMNMMDSVMTPGGVGYLPRDMGGVSVLDSAATLLNGLASELGWKDRRIPRSAYMRETGEALLDMSAPVIQAIIKQGEFRDLRVPGHVAEKLAKMYGVDKGGEPYKGGLFTIDREGGRARVRLNNFGSIVAGLSGLSVFATTAMRHADSLEQGGLKAVLNTAGLLKFYDYPLRGNDSVRETRNILSEYGDAIFALSADGEGSRLWIDSDIPGATPEFMEFINALFYAVGGGDRRNINQDGFLQQMMRDTYEHFQYLGIIPRPHELPTPEPVRVGPK